MATTGPFERMKQPTENQAELILIDAAQFMIDTLDIRQQPGTKPAFDAAHAKQFNTVTQKTLGLHMAAQGLLKAIQNGLIAGTLSFETDPASKTDRFKAVDKVQA